VHSEKAPMKACLVIVRLPSVHCLDKVSRGKLAVFFHLLISFPVSWRVDGVSLRRA